MSTVFIKWKKLENLLKRVKLDKYFPEEEDVFNFLGMVYKGPTERVDGTSVVLLEESTQGETKPKLKLKLVLKLLVLLLLKII